MLEFVSQQQQKMSIVLKKKFHVKTAWTNDKSGYKRKNNSITTYLRLFWSFFFIAGSVKMKTKYQHQPVTVLHKGLYNISHTSSHPTRL
jgi:hypothetical protein